MHEGELCTWAKLSAIHCNCGIESMLDACIQQVWRGGGWGSAPVCACGGLTPPLVGGKERSGGPTRTAVPLHRPVPPQVSTWERQERRKAAGALLPLKSRIPSWMHLPSLMHASASLESLAGAGGSNSG